jgi:iron complex outermembrane receptor protein
MSKFARVSGASLAFVAAAAVADDARVSALADLSLEQLREIVVTSVSRRDERLDRTAASVYVIGREAIQRAGALTLPEALRLAPNLDVARADASQYAISARGFNNVLANKMLVLVDGRVVYSPLFSGVFWDTQTVPLDDIERIEVVDGPSSALWGSNAVNGLIHVITRRAADTQGTQLSAHAGSQQRGADLRWGAALGRHGHYRLFGQAWKRSHSEFEGGGDLADGGDGARVGFRTDVERDNDALTVEGALYAANFEQLPSGRDIAGAHLLGRWQRKLGDGGQATLQAYWDRTTRKQPPQFRERLDTVDAVAQWALPVRGRHRALFGAGVRHAHDDTDNGPALAFVPADRSLDWWRLFGQDEVSLGSFELTLAGSIERNPYTGTEVLPSVRLAWQQSEHRLLWAALSRAVRAPSRVDREFYAPAQPPYQIAGGPDFRAEVSDVLELGMRAQPTAALSYALTLFHHRHRDLRSLTPTPGGAVFENRITGSTGGVSTWATWRPLPHWQLTAGAVLLDQQLRLETGAVDAGGLAALGNDPKRWASLRSSLDIGDALQWDVALRHVGERPLPDVPSYTAVDTRLAWRLPKRVELSLAVHDLLDGSGHVEWGPAGSRVEWPRSVALQLRWTSP